MQKESYGKLLLWFSTRALSQISRSPHIPMASSFRSRRPWGTLSKALAKSRNRIWVLRERSSECAQRCIDSKNWVRLECFALKPCWEVERILLVSRKAWSWAFEKLGQWAYSFGGSPFSCTGTAFAASNHWGDFLHWWILKTDQLAIHTHKLQTILIKINSLPGFIAL